MSQRRLPMLKSPPAPAAGGPVGGLDPVVVPGAVVVGDTGVGEVALRWVARLELELARRDRPVQVVLVGSTQSEAALRGLFSAAAQLATLEPALLDAAADPAARGAAVSALAAGSPFLLVGPSALALFRGRLNVLIGADEPLLRWPAPLRALRGRFELELSGDGLTLAPALADALRDKGA